MTAGKLEHVDYLLPAAQEAGLDLAPLMATLKSQKHWMLKLANRLRVEPEAQVVKPSFRWAQSLTHVFLDVKYSHRIDSAGCSELYEKHYDLTASRLTFHGKCLHSNHKLEFRLDLDFFDVVLPETSTVNENLAGRIEFQLQKALQPAVWDQLYAGSEKPPNMSLWWDMQNFYADEIEEFTRISASL